MYATNVTIQKTVYNTSRNCILCLEDNLETRQHFLIECRIARLLQGKLGLAPHTMSDVLGLREPSYDQLQTSVRYVQTLYKLVRARRLGATEPQPLTDDSIQSLVKYI